MNTFRLCWKARVLGEVCQLSGDFPYIWATLHPGPGMDETFRALFTFIVDEERYGEEPPFDQELLDDENWWLVDGRDKPWGISLPGVYLNDNTIAWRWRGEIPDWQAQS